VKITGRHDPDLRLGISLAAGLRTSAPELLLGGFILALAAVAGLVAAQSPTTALGLAVSAGLACVASLRHRLSGLFLIIMPGLLLGYALFDKAFAYVGVYPVYVGEVALLIAALHVVAGRPIRLTWLHFSWLHWMLIAFMALGLARTLPYLSRDGIDALRDASLWGYGVFAVALSLALRVNHFSRVISLFRIAIPVFLVWTPVAGLLSRLYGSELPTVFGSTTSLLTLKSGDLGVHLAGIGAFLIVGLSWRRLSHWIPETLMWVLWMLGVAIVGAANRAAFLAASAAFAGGLLIPPPARLIWRFAVALALAGILVAAIPATDVANQRTLSIDQIVRNIASIVTDSGAPELESSKAWREQWWNTIVDYTVNGPYFWTGKGFGLNLADDDGFQVDAVGSLRSPHNSHLTVLARMGVPGLLLWVLLQLGFATSLLWSFLRARRNHADFWCRIDAWLFAYWLAMIVNASFDVYFEGPQGGIWFWSVFGLGLAAIGIQRSLFDGADRERELAGRPWPKRLPVDTAVVTPTFQDRDAGHDAAPVRRTAH